MAKKQRRKSQITKKVQKQKELLNDDDVQIEEEKVKETRGQQLLASIDAMSDEDDHMDGDEDEEWNAEARALRQAIAEGAFDKLGNVSKIEENDENDDDIDDAGSKEDDQEEVGDVDVQLEDDSSEEGGEEEESSNENNDEVNENEQSTSQSKEQQQKQSSGVDKALVRITAELKLAKDKLPWAEKYDITPSTSLPFGKKDEEGMYIDIHDDLKREVVFYNLALEAVHEGRKKCAENKIPFSRPDDFFAEMVKTDDHMAKVKDRLIFESKKMESFEQRKSNREQKLRAKEAHAHRLSEKAKSKKRHMQDVEDWAKSAASNRVGNNMVRDDDDEYLNRMNNPSKKRQAMNRKYGYGGKKGRFKQNDRDSMNDMSGYNPKGNFAGGKKSSGTKRKGKRARDAAKARR